jgi:hypothetical protein
MTKPLLIRLSLAALMVGAIGLAIRRQYPPVDGKVPPAPTPAPAQRTARAISGGPVFASDSSEPESVEPATVPGPLAVPVNPPEPSVANRLEQVAFVIRDFRNALSQNPSGTNAEITAALLGGNLKQIRFPVPEGSSVNSRGELCDFWGRPYFFHQLSGTEMEIRSAGPDLNLWTPDDVIAR